MRGFFVPRKIMEQNLLIALGAGLGGMLGWGFADFFAKKTIDEIGATASLVWGHIFGVLALAVIALYQFVAFQKIIFIPHGAKELGLLAFFGVLQAFIYFLVYRGFSKGQLAVLSPVFASYSGLAALFSVLVLGEAIRGNFLLALGVIFVGILLVNIDGEALRMKRITLLGAPGLKEVGSAALLAAFWTVSWDRFIGGKDWVSYPLVMYVFIALAAWLISRWQRTNLTVARRGLWKFLILIGVCEVAAYLAISLGFSSTQHLSIVAILSSAFSLPAMALAYVFLKERMSAVQTVGGAIIVAGIVLLSVF